VIGVGVWTKCEICRSWFVTTRLKRDELAWNEISRHDCVVDSFCGSIARPRFTMFSHMVRKPQRHNPCASIMKFSLRRNLTSKYWHD